MLEEFLNLDMQIQKNQNSNKHIINCLLCKYNCPDKCYHGVIQIDKHPCYKICDFYKRDYSKKL